MTGPLDSRDYHQALPTFSAVAIFTAPVCLFVTSHDTTPLIIKIAFKQEVENVKMATESKIALHSSSFLKKYSQIFLAAAISSGVLCNNLKYDNVHISFPLSWNLQPTMGGRLMAAISTWTFSKCSSHMRAHHKLYHSSFGMPNTLKMVFRGPMWTKYSLP